VHIHSYQRCATIGLTAGIQIIHKLPGRPFEVYPSPAKATTASAHATLNVAV
jgi:hypothetical protein